MDQWEVIRLRCVRDGEPIKRVARELRLAPNTVRKYVRTLVVPTKTTIARKCRLDRYEVAIDEYIRATPKITAKRIGDLLLAEHDLSLIICERSLRLYVARRRQRLVPREAFVRADYLPGDQAQFDFSPMRVVLAGIEQIVHLFAMRLSYSGHMFARASHRQDQPALFTGMLAAVQFFAGIPRVAIFDNAKTAVQKINSGRDREENTAFASFRGALALQVEFAAPRRGNEKGGIEGTFGYIEDNFFRPVPSFTDLDELNAALATFCHGQLQRVHSTHRELIGDRFAKEQQVLRELPEVLPKACITQFARINKFAEVTIETNRYSVPTRFAYRDAIVEIYDQRVVVLVDGATIAEHRKAVGKSQMIIDPLHYIELISHKHRSATRATAFGHERLPAALLRLRDRLLEECGPKATKTWTAILRLALDSSLDALAQATDIALARGTIDPQAIALLLRQRSGAAALMDSGRATPVLTAHVIDLDVYRIAEIAEVAS